MLSRLLRQSGVYAVANAVGKASGLLLVVFYGNAEYLSTERFGYFGLVRSTMMFGLLVSGLGLALAIIRFMTAREVPPEEQAAVPFTGLVMAALGGLGVGALVWVFAPVLAVELDGDVPPLRWLSVYIVIKTVSDVAFQVLRQQERVGLFAAASVAEITIQAAAVIAFLVGARQGVAGIFMGYTLAAAVVGIPMVVRLLSQIEWRVSRTLVRPMLAFGLPLVLSGFAGRALYYGDRFFIVKMMGLNANGVYEWASSYGGIVHAFLVQSFQLAFTVLGIKALDAEGGRPDLHRRTFRHLMAGGGFVALGIGLFADDATLFLVTHFGVEPVYLGTGGLAFLIASGFAFYALYYVAVNVLYAAKRTRTVAATVLAAGALNLTLNAVLIPVIGLAGAALATLVAYAALAVATAVLGERESRAGYPWRGLLAVVLLVAGLWLAALPSAGWPVLVRLATRAGLVAAYLPLLLPLGVYGRADLDQLRGILAGRRRAPEHGGISGSTRLPEDPPPGTLD